METKPRQQWVPTWRIRTQHNNTGRKRNLKGHKMAKQLQNQVYLLSSCICLVNYFIILPKKVGNHWATGHIKNLNYTMFILVLLSLRGCEIERTAMLFKTHTM